MNDEKVWAKIPLTKLSKAPLLTFVAIGFTPLIQSLFDKKPVPIEETLILWAVLIILYRIIALWKLVIATDRQGLHIRSGFKDELIQWENFHNYFVNEDQVVIYTHENTPPYTVNFQFLQEKDSFIELLWSKLQKIETIECLNCGEPIKPDQNNCPNCN
jgi:hypothetical protein